MLRLSIVASCAVALLAGCVPAPPIRPPATPEPTPLTPRIVAGITQEHLPDGAASYAAGAPGAVGAAVHYRATGRVPAWTVTVGLGPTPGWLAPKACRAASGAPRAHCFREGEVRVAWPDEGTEVLLVAPRRDGFATVLAEGRAWDGDPRRGARPVDLDALLELARDPRLDATTDPRLPLRAENLPNWRDDLACDRARRAGTTSLPASAATGGTGAATPQAFAALLAAEVNARCVGEWEGTPAEVGAVAYLGGGTEWLAAYVTTDPTAGDCPAGWETCGRVDGATIAYRFDRPGTSPAKVWLSRPIADGFVVLQQASRKADARTRVFPVAMATMRRLLADNRFAFTVTSGLTTAGNNLPLCWRIAPRVDVPATVAPDPPRG